MSEGERTTVAVIAHGGSLDACLRSWLGIARNGHREGRAFTFGNASLSLVRVETHSYRVLLLNDTCHLRCNQEGGGI
jgi:broad specificity phosphatase PhoE